MSFKTALFRKWLKIFIIATSFFALLASLLMILDTLQNSERFAHFYTYLLVFNLIAILTLLALVAFNLGHLIQQLRKKRAGAWLMVRIVTLLVILSIVPVTVVYYFSLRFLYQRLDNWFDVNIEETLSDALDLSRASLDARMRDALKQTKKMAKEISLLNTDMIALQLNELRKDSGAVELTLLANDGQIIASNNLDLDQFLPTQSDDSRLLQLNHTNSYISLEPVGEKGLHIRVIVKLVQGNRSRLLHALYPIDERMNTLANQVEEAYLEYKGKTYLHDPLKQNVTLILSLVLLLSIFSVVWLAFFATRRLVAPLSSLVEGTRAVANGNYDKRLPVSHFNELGFLVDSFNDMTHKIALARDEVKQSQQLADRQREYLEAVLKRLSSGVISLDYKQRLRTTNPAADHILELPLSTLLGKSFTELEQEYPSLHAFYATVEPHLSSNHIDWREEMTWFGNTGRKILMCRGTQLQEFKELHWQRFEQLDKETVQRLDGHVIVFDDITTLIQAERDAAWSEVARRLAHEIKNPLTPIQLSAERLRQKYLRTLPEKEAETLDRLTHTIIQQVDAMKEMVNAFSNYAKTPTIHLQKLNLNQFIKEILDLYHYEQYHFVTLLEENLPLIEADKGRLRQVLHNLIKNALEADSECAKITITTRHLVDSSVQCIELRIQDQGPGIPEQLRDHIFEPYMTTKAKGSGLGLAIVRKIVEEHGGMVWIESQPGTCVIIRLPVTVEGTQS